MAISLRVRVFSFQKAVVDVQTVESSSRFFVHGIVTQYREPTQLALLLSAQSLLAARPCRMPLQSSSSYEANTLF